MKTKMKKIILIGIVLAIGIVAVAPVTIIGQEDTNGSPDIFLPQKPTFGESCSPGVPEPPIPPV